MQTGRCSCGFVGVNSVTISGCVEHLSMFFSSSTHCWDVLTSITGQSVHCITEIQWSGKGEAVIVVKKHFSEILSALEKLTEEEENIATKADTGFILTGFQSFFFLCFLSL